MAAADAATKRHCAICGSFPDRLSTLPEELRRQILSFLPAQEVVRTTVLSKRWKDLWRSVPGINLDLSDFQREGVAEDENETWARFEDVGTNVLLLHNAPCLDALRLTMRIDGQNGRHRVVDRWVRRALDGNPLVLQVLVLGFQNSVYRYGSLNSLLPSPCRRLKQLELSSVYLDESFAERLHALVPCLEDLILRRCYSWFSAIHSDKLKNLVVDNCESQPADVFVVRAPGLSSLCLDLSLNTYRKGISLDVGNSLISASVAMRYGQTSPRSQAKLIGTLSSVTSLELIHFQPTAMLDEEFDKIQIFNNLRTLSLISCLISNDEHYVHTFKPLHRFLQKCPNLEKFTSQQFPSVQAIESYELHTLENLRTLFLGRCGLQDDFALLRHCLQRSPNLEKLTLDLCELSGSAGQEGKAEPKNYSPSRNLATFQCPKLKSTEIIYGIGHDDIPELVRVLLDFGCAPENSITFTNLEKLYPFF